MSSNTEYNKVCAHCGTHFIAKKMSTKHCSHKCASRAYKQNKRAQRVETNNIEFKNSQIPPIFHQETNPSNQNLSTLKEMEYLSAARLN